MVEHWQLRSGALPQWWSTGSSGQELSLNGGALAAQVRSSPSMVEHWQLKPGTLPQWWSTGSSNQEFSLNGGALAGPSQEFSLNGGALAAQVRSYLPTDCQPSTFVYFNFYWIRHVLVSDQKLKLYWHCFEHSHVVLAYGYKDMYIVGIMKVWLDIAIVLCPSSLCYTLPLSFLFC